MLSACSTLLPDAVSLLLKKIQGKLSQPTFFLPLILSTFYLVHSTAISQQFASSDGRPHQSNPRMKLSCPLWSFAPAQEDFEY